MTNVELIDLLSNYPYDAKLNVHIDGESSELSLKSAHVEHDGE